MCLPTAWLEESISKWVSSSLASLSTRGDFNPGSSVTRLNAVVFMVFVFCNYWGWSKFYSCSRCFSSLMVFLFFLLMTIEVQKNAFQIAVSLSDLQFQCNRWADNSIVLQFSVLS